MDGRPCDPRHAWLPALIPADALRFRVSDPSLAATLEFAGAMLVHAEPEVEIGSRRDLRGDSRVAIVTVDRAPPAASRDDSRPRAVRASERVVAFARAWADGRAALRALRRHGYRDVTAFTWDVEQPLRPFDRLPHHIEGFPRAVLAIGARELLGPSALDEVLLAVGETRGGTSRRGRLLVREAGVVVVGDTGVVRAAVGPGARLVRSQADALADLWGRNLPEGLERVLPRILGRGRAGLVDWTAERRLPGRAPAYPLAGWVLRESLAFLTALHATGRSEGGGVVHVDRVVSVCSPATGARIRRLADALTHRLETVQRGFAHGDFWSGNLLIEGKTLSGVVDWDYASSGRTPLLDLLHLLVNAPAPLPPEAWGPAVVNRLLPEARAGGGELVREYCARLGLATTPDLLVDLVLAYWLDRLAFEVGTYVDRRQRKRWVANNVEFVLDAADGR